VLRISVLVDALGRVALLQLHLKVSLLPSPHFLLMFPLSSHFLFSLLLPLPVSSPRLTVMMAIKYENLLEKVTTDIVNS
jgi:hypothetical protein